MRLIYRVNKSIKIWLCLTHNDSKRICENIYDIDASTKLRTSQFVRQIHFSFVLDCISYNVAFTHIYIYIYNFFD